MELFVKGFDELSPERLYALIRARESVFVVEQQCPYPELDGKDLAAWHVWLEEDGAILSVGRVLTLRRGCGLGTKIMEAGLRVAEEKFGPGPIRIEAQAYAVGFYRRFGFRQVSEEFMEDGIPHVEMLRE